MHPEDLELPLAGWFNPVHPVNPVEKPVRSPASNTHLMTSRRMRPEHTTRPVRQRTSRLLLRVLLALALPLILLLAATGSVAAEPAPPNRAGLVVRFGDGTVQTACVDLGPDGEATGEDLLDAASLQPVIEYTALGGTVCEIDRAGLWLSRRGLLVPVQGRRVVRLLAVLPSERRPVAGRWPAMGLRDHRREPARAAQRRYRRLVVGRGRRRGRRRAAADDAGRDLRG